jgi:uncharacterized protein YbbC (DUF1343 family)
VNKITTLLVFLITISLQAQIKLGIDVIQESNFKIIEGKRVALLSNFASRNYKGELTFDVFKEQNKFQFKCNFTPEHGFYTTQTAGKHIDNDTLYGIPLVSLYGKFRKPTNEMLDSIDVIVVDIQDVGIRSYTYISTVYNLMTSAAELNKELIILDRPNPLGGVSIDGNTVQDDYRSFVSVIPIPYIHACTIGELAEIINGEKFMGQDNKGKDLKCNLKVVKMPNWKRSFIWEDTGLQWYPTSPNIPNVSAVRGMAVLGLLGELGIVNIGIGTTSPFQYIGSPDFKADEFEIEINKFDLSPIQLNRTTFTPFFGLFANKTNIGFYLNIIPSADFFPFKSFLNITNSLKKTNPELFDETKLVGAKQSMFKKVTGTKVIFDYLFGNLKELPSYTKDIEHFTKLRTKYLLYK